MHIRMHISICTHTAAQTTIQVLCRLFASYGSPHQLVSDNGPQFVSKEFEKFMKLNGITHIRCAPYHPSSNGLVEQFVQTFKGMMKVNTLSSDQVPMNHKLADFLQSYRSTPHTTTNQTPSLLFIKREIRTKLDLMKPNLANRVLDCRKLADTRIVQVEEKVSQYIVFTRTNYSSD